MKRKTRHTKGHKLPKRKKSTIDRAVIEAVLGIPQVWSSPPVAGEPMRRLEAWTVYRATPHGGPSDRFGLHFVGRDLSRWSGCVSSKIVSFDPEALRGTTQSGRIYQLYGTPGHCQNGDYVLEWWTRFNDLTVEDVTIEFLESHDLTFMELAERFARGEVRPILVFVDFDVLHPQPLHNRGTVASICMERFQSTMRALPICNIVISSNRRQGFDLNTIRGYFSDKIAVRIVGATPVIDQEAPYVGQREIEQYLRENNQSGGSWLALSDQPEAFEPDLPNLVLCDKEGYGEAAARKLASKLRELI